MLNTNRYTLPPSFDFRLRLSRHDNIWECLKKLFSDKLNFIR